MKSSYSEAERTAIKSAWEAYQSEFARARKTGLGTFVKDERYEDYKPHRLINARHDFYKALFGPVFHAVEEHVFKMPHFVKGRADKVAAIVEAMEQLLPIIVEGDDCLMADGKGGAIVSDYDAYESLFTHIWFALERLMFEELLGDSSAALEFLDVYYEVTGVRNVSVVRGKDGKKSLQIAVDAKRMSGEMTTSLGNCLANLLAQFYIYSNFICAGKIPTKEDYEKVGLRCKVEHHEDMSEAGFCGLRFDMQDRQAVKDPLPVLLKLGWSKAQYVSAGPAKLKILLELKALSLAHELPQCPILGVISRLNSPTKMTTQHLHVLRTGFNEFERSKFHGTIGEFSPTPRTRELFARLYGISVDTQIAVERQYAVTRDAACLVPLFQGKDRWAEVWDDYVAGAEGFYVPTLCADRFFQRYPVLLEVLARSWTEKHRHVRSSAVARHRLKRHAKRKLSVEDNKILETLGAYLAKVKAVGHHARHANARGAAPPKSASTAVSE